MRPFWWGRTLNMPSSRSQAGSVAVVYKMFDQWDCCIGCAPAMRGLQDRNAHRPASTKFSDPSPQGQTLALLPADLAQLRFQYSPTNNKPRRARRRGGFLSGRALQSGLQFLDVDDEPL